MSVKQTPKKKGKQNPASINRREMIHLDYLNVYNEVLKYDEVIDLDIDLILDVTKSVFQRELSLSKLASSPTEEELQGLAVKIIDEIRELRKAANAFKSTLCGAGIIPNADFDADII